MEWHLPPDVVNEFCVVEVMNGAFHSRHSVMPTELGNIRKVNSGDYVLEWGKLYQFEIRRVTDEADELMFKLEREASRQKMPLIRLITVDLRDKNETDLLRIVFFGAFWVWGRAQNYGPSRSGAKSDRRNQGPREF